MKNAWRLLILSTSALCLLPQYAAAQTTENDTTDESTSDRFLEEIVVTGVVRQGTRLESSTSTSSISPERLQNFAPRSTAEIFRNIPGIRSESSGGGGNANIAVRGIPISTGGAKFLSLQEDGLPVLQFGDIAFGNADNFLRADNSISRIEAIRGGSASTFAQNSPGGIINFISRTGKEEGGSIGILRGIGFDQTRVDFNYGAPVADNWSFHVGGFYRIGEGLRDTGYNGDDGGQIKANVTRNFDNGFVRFYFKHLNDRVTTFLPAPLLVTGTNESPRFRSVPGFNAKNDTLHTPNLLQNFGLDGDNNFRSSDVKDGIRSLSTTFGLEFEFDLLDGWSLNNKARYASNEGGFVSPFPASIASAQSIAEEIGGPGATLAFATGANAGQAITDPGALNGNGLATRVALFDVDVNNFDNFANDLKVSKTFSDGSDGEIDITFGYYKASQTIDMDWVWNSYLLDVDGENGNLLDVFSQDGTPQTLNGLFQFGDPFGGCCNRSYDIDYDTDAPYASVAWSNGAINVDGSVRYTYGSAAGVFAGTVRGPLDVNRDGAITGPENNVSFVDNQNSSTVDYSYDYISYSFGANYLLNDDLAVFARYSRGASANADRLPFGPSITAAGDIADEDSAIDFVKQLETGVKYRNGNLNLFGTFFYAKTEETNFNLTDQTFTDRKYRAYGIEFEGTYSIGQFDLTAGATWTDAEISRDNIDAALEGNTPRRQADFIYQLTPSYSDYGFTVGANIVGTTSSFAQFNNELKLPGFTQVNLFTNYDVTDNLLLSFNINNLFDTLGVTEAEEGSVLPNSNAVIRARSIPGRTASVSLKYNF